MRQHRADAATSRPGEGDNEVEELGGDVGVGSAAAAAGATSSGRRGELIQVWRIGQHDVVRAVTPVPGESVADHDIDVTAPVEEAPGRLDGHNIDVDAMELSMSTGCRDVIRGGAEESAVAACRVEDGDPLTGLDRRHHGVDNAVNEVPRGCVVAPSPPATAGLGCRR